MEQINFRIKSEEKSIMKWLAESKGISVAEFAKQSVLNDIADERIEIAFDLVKEGKIGRKRAWTLSGLSHLEFLNEWSKRKIEETITDEILQKELNLAMEIDFSNYRKT
jgi:predicted HTH domain antitoxin